MGLFGKKDKEKSRPENLPKEGETFAIVNLDKTGVDSSRQEKVIRELSKGSGYDFFEGQIEHAYTLGKLGQHATCPRCKAPTQRQYGNFVYAVEEDGPRLSTSPAGYFCTKCPTVIIDEDIVRKSMSGNFTFAGVVAMEVNGRLVMFKTWNGADPVHILDEDGNPAGVMSKNDLDENVFPEDTAHSRSAAIDQQKRKARNRKKNRAAKKSRKANRRKK